LEADTEPQAGEHEVPDCMGLQVTPATAGSFATVALNCNVEFSGMRALPGETETVIAGTVIEAVAIAPL
jgi:hypothetical protein